MFDLTVVLAAVKSNTSEDSARPVGPAVPAAARPRSLKPCRRACLRHQWRIGNSPRWRTATASLRLSGLVKARTGVAHNRHNQGVHLPNVKFGCQRLKGQKRTEMMY